jgi:hypothetical protein
LKAKLKTGTYDGSEIRLRARSSEAESMSVKRMVGNLSDKSVKGKRLFFDLSRLGA